jgi:hypothetical protein
MRPPMRLAGRVHLRVPPDATRRDAPHPNRMGVEVEEDLDELKQDVKPESVLGTIEAATHEPP